VGARGWRHPWAASLPAACRRRLRLAGAARRPCRRSGGDTEAELGGAGRAGRQGGALGEAGAWVRAKHQATVEGEEGDGSFSAGHLVGELLAGSRRITCADPHSPGSRPRAGRVARLAAVRGSRRGRGQRPGGPVLTSRARSASSSGGDGNRPAHPPGVPRCWNATCRPATAARHAALLSSRCEGKPRARAPQRGRIVPGAGPRPAHSPG
jgi:hypothetical protein